MRIDQSGNGELALPVDGFVGFKLRFARRGDVNDGAVRDADGSRVNFMR